MKTMCLRALMLLGIVSLAVESCSPREAPTSQPLDSPTRAVQQAASLAPLAIAPFQPAIVWGGRTVAIDIAATSPNVAITATESGGLFETTTGGTTWAPISTLIPFRMDDVRIAPPSPTARNAFFAKMTLFKLIALFVSRSVNVTQSVEVKILPFPTATSSPAPYVTLCRLSGYGGSDQVMLSVETRTTLASWASPTARKRPLP